MALTYVEYGLIFCLSLSLFALVVALKSLSRIREQAEQQERIYQRLTKELAVSNSGSVGMGQRLVAMEKKLQTAAKTQTKIDYYQDDEYQPYTQAAQMFKMGLDIDEVSRRCGLSRAEASLIHMMQSHTESAQTPQ